MRNGRRLTAVGIITGGLLLIGLAAPSLADETSGPPSAGVTTVSSVAALAGTSADDPAQSCQPADANCHDDTCDSGFEPGIGGLCVPVAPCLDPPDYNGADEDGCGTDPDACPPAQQDYNQGDPGCGTDPDACPPGQDFNGPDVPGCGTDPNACPPGQTDYNGHSQAGCGTDPDACTTGVDYNGELAGCGSAPTPEDPPSTCPTGSHDYNGSAPGCGTGSTDGVCPPGKTDYNGAIAGCGTKPSRGPKGHGGHPAGPVLGSPAGHGPRGLNGADGPSVGAGGSSSSDGSGSEGTVPGASSGGSSPGTTACGDPAICNDSGILGIEASASVPSSSASADDGSVLPETGAPASTQGLLVLGFGLVAAGSLLVRPRRLARHKA